MASDRTPLVGDNLSDAAHGAILYALISRGSTILAEESLGSRRNPVSGNFAVVASKLLARFPNADGRNTYKYDEQHDFHLYSRGGLFFLCLAEHGVSLRIAYGLLGALQEKFVANYDGSWERANAYAMSDFAQIISSELKRFNDPESDKMNRLQNSISDVKNVMRQNINKVLERGEKIDLLVDKSEALAESATVFHKRAKKLKWTMCRENAKLWIIIVIVILVVIGIIVAVVCGGGHCGGSSGGSGASPSASRMLRTSE